METLRIMAEKGMASLINSAIALLLSMPFLAIWGNGIAWKLSVVGLFLLYNFLVMACNGDRCLGMMIQGRFHKRLPGIWNQVLNKFLYTLSFATVVFWYATPFDLLTLNMLCLQVPCIMATGTTVHGYLSDES